MNKDIIEGGWKEFKGKLRTKWGKLTDDDLEASKGKVDEIKGRIQKSYGQSKEEIEKEYDEFRQALSEQERERYNPYLH